jgi:hypothetical protein
MKLIEIKRATANFCVICSSGFANVGDFTFFESEQDAKAFAEENSARIVDEDGLAEKFEAMHCAEGRDPRNDSHGQFIENPDDAEEIWAAQYAENAAEEFRNATVFEIEVEDTEETA